MTGYWLSLAVFVVLALMWVRQHLGLKQTQQLADIPADIPADPPKVSIIFSALNEAATIEPALRSLLQLDYPKLEIIAVNDRSTDDTGAIMDRMALAQPNLRVIHIHELPPGWLGKNHALFKAAEVATGDYLLFTDADVLFDPAALRRAVHHCENAPGGKLDHLVVMAEFLVQQPLLASLLINFLSFGFALHAPWKVKTSSNVYLGMGAFNMVRADSYRKAGGHTPLRLAVVDDIMLGRLMKRPGSRQDALFGLRAVSLEWYKDAADLARGLEKNTYAMIDFNPARLVLSTFSLALIRYWPMVGLFVTSGAAWWFNVGAIVSAFLIHFDIFLRTRWSARCFWWWPLSPAIMIGIMWRAVILTIRRKGIIWRGTLYSLEELRRGRA